MKLFLVGGFLGSGKTTAIQHACLQLMEKAVRVGVVTNDQGEQLVDSGFMKASSVPTREVPNGCFCCNYGQLESSIEALRERHQPEVVFAESVGSCTDLVATVVKPWLKFHPNADVVVSVFADGGMLSNFIRGSRLFVDSINYIYHKQLEEADVLVINKMDLLTAQQLGDLKQLIEKRYPARVVLYLNSLERNSIAQWLNTLLTFPRPGDRASLEMDYDTYSAGEAQLGWLDAEVTIRTVDNRAMEAAMALIHQLGAKIKEKQLAIGHLKFLIDDGKRLQKISVTFLAPTTWEPIDAETETAQVKLLMNARVQVEPTLLKKIFLATIAELEYQRGCQLSVGKMAAFQPGYPKPTHRIPNG